MEPEQPKVATDHSKKRKRKKDAQGENVEFAKDEVVYAFSGPMLYEARVLQVETKPTRKYLIHYKGWKNTHDEWVSGENLRKFNAENEKVQQELKLQMKDAKRAKVAAPPPKPVAATIDTKMETVEDDISSYSTKLPLAPQLKKQLVDDWEKVTQKKLIVKLPHENTVASFLAAFLESKEKKATDPDTTKATRELVDGLRAYFDLCLPRLLLYRFERLQYMAITERETYRNKPASEVYGLEHFLRLYMKLPQLLDQTQVEDGELLQLQSLLADLLKFLQKKRERFMPAGSYVKASEDYIYAFENNLGTVAPRSKKVLKPIGPASG